MEVLLPLKELFINRELEFDYAPEDFKFYIPTLTFMFLKAIYELW